MPPRCRRSRAAVGPVTTPTANRLDMIYDATFHDPIAELAGNRWLRESLGRLRSHLHMYRLYHHAGQAAATKPEHVAIARRDRQAGPGRGGRSDAVAPGDRHEAARRRLRIGPGHASALMAARDIPVVDSHVHVWNASRAEYPWLHEVPQLPRPCELAEFWPEQAAVGVRQVVLVQAADNVEDTENMLRTARAHARGRRDRRLGPAPRRPGRRGAARSSGGTSPSSASGTWCTATPTRTSSGTPPSTRRSTCSASEA